MKHELPNLAYSYDSLEPYIDATTMNIHHSKHHAAYVNNLNAALEAHPDLQERSVEELLTSLDKLPDIVYWAVRNNGGGHYNHSIFWSVIGPHKNVSEPTGELAQKLGEKYNSFDYFKEAFGKAALTRFGSGWAWLVLDKNGSLDIVSTANQDNPISDGLKPILGLDVWEHAYYLKYTNRRADYISAWWNIVDWEAVSKRYESLK
ncbi:MAG: superoxide dismutase [Clostridia bacterium]|nr:superoxide dismutase [Clostridia bacterium]